VLVSPQEERSPTASLLSLSRMGPITVDRLDLEPVRYGGLAGDRRAPEAAEWMSRASLETSETSCCTLHSIIASFSEDARVRLAMLYLDALQGGGYPKDIRWLAGALARRGLSVSLAAKPGPYRDGLDSVGLVSPSDFGVRAREADVVHVWMLFVPGQLRFWRKLSAEVPLVVSPGGHLMTAHLKRRWWKKLPFLAVMQPTLSRLRPVAHLFSDRERTGAHRWLRSSRYFEGSLGIFPAAPAVRAADSADYLLFLGRNDVYQKGIDVLVKGYAEARRHGLSLPLVIAGQPYRNSQTVLRDLASDLKITKWVHRMGEVSEKEKNQLIAEARCFVFLSRWDGPPRPIREAIALGTPVVVSWGTNLAAVVEAAGAGRGVELGTHQVATALLECENEATLKTWQTGVSSLRSDLTWDTVGDQYESGYRSAFTSESG
jgi:glycosyltransferase involved in cell wall biosynthesis